MYSYPPTFKSWWQSKTLWINAIVASLVALEGTTGFLQPQLPVNLYAAVAVSLPILNVILRVLTTKGLK